MQVTLMEITCKSELNCFFCSAQRRCRVQELWVGQVHRKLCINVALANSESLLPWPTVRVCVLQASTPASMTPGSARKSGWGRSKTTKKSRLSTAECTSIVDGLKLIYFTRVCALASSAPGSNGKTSKEAGSQTKHINTSELVGMFCVLMIPGQFHQLFVMPACRFVLWKRHTSLERSSHRT